MQRALLPVLSKKKIYLIDEAHMLSKAAFNALLKILEEPPTGVIFMLATTELHKIIDTVKSRCFQLFFPPIDKSRIVEHLSAICSKEDIPYEIEGLKVIAQESEGSLRDAINLMERVRLAYATVDKKAALELLGYIDDARLIELFCLILKGDVKEILSYIKEVSLNNFAPTIVWKKFVEIIRASIWVKYSSDPNNIEMSQYFKNIPGNSGPVQNLVAMLEIAYEYEPLLNKTSAAHEMVEMMIIKMSLVSTNEKKEPSILKNVEKVIDSAKTIVEAVAVVKNEKTLSQDSPWVSFNQEIEKLNDPLLASIFKQGKFIKIDLPNMKLQVQFSQGLKFFEEKLNSMTKVWQPIIERVFGQKLDLEAIYIETPIANIQAEPLTEKPVQVNTSKIIAEKKIEKVILKPVILKQIDKLDIQDKEKWKLTNMILDVFPGTVNQIENN